MRLIKFLCTCIPFRNAYVPCLRISYAEFFSENRVKTFYTKQSGEGEECNKDLIICSFRHIVRRNTRGFKRRMQQTRGMQTQFLYYVLNRKYEGVRPQWIFRGYVYFYRGKNKMDKGPLVRPRRRWEDNIKMDLQKVGCGCMHWIELAQDRDTWRALVKAAMNLRVP